ncbi:hypothetical protein KAR91_18330 [Candidatus Pacearchaeota archaeon]|nr:hypothetical protein [Candidatus Pacearchaeota archaeon]
MSTYYKFQCPVCKKTGGFFSRQAWGYGNCALIDNFKFMIKHMVECSANMLIIISEHDSDCYDAEEDTDYLNNNYMPHSRDWRVVKEMDEFTTKEYLRLTNHEKEVDDEET